MLYGRALAVAVRAINHLLGEEKWARERLARFAGQRARIEVDGVSALALPLLLGADGLLAAGDASAPPDVTITLAADAPLKTLTESASLLAGARISGSAELAETLGFVFRNLSWDVEDEISYFVGDIAARRFVEGGKRFFGWQREQAKNFAGNVVEYLVEEKPTLVGKRQVAAFSAEVSEVEAELARLEARVAALVGKTSRPVS